jgi:hypothetical protein
MLGFIRSVPSSLEGLATDESTTFSWGVVPKSAEVGDWVATITGCGILFLVYPQPRIMRDTMSRRGLGQDYRVMATKMLRSYIAG